MRSKPAYFIFWLPTITLCGIVVVYFLVMWSNAPRFPSHGMEELIVLPYAFVSLAMSPFLIGFGILSWLRPHRSALNAAYVIPTVLLTMIGIAAFFFIPGASAATHTVRLSFVDQRGNPVSDLSAILSHSSPGFDIIRGGTPHREEAFRIAGSEFTLIKTKGEESGLQIEKEGYYLTGVTIPNVWPPTRNHGLQRINIGWQKDWHFKEWGVDACQATINWPLKPQEPLKVVMLDLQSPATSPLPEYSERDFRDFENANR